MALEINFSVVVGQARDRVDGLVGLVAVIVGFTLQGLAYAFTLSGLGGGEVDTRRGVVAVALALASAVLVLVIWKLVEKPLLDKTLIDVSRVDFLKDPAELRANPSGVRLAMLAQELGHRPEEGESAADFVRRVWDVDVGPEIDRPEE